MKRGAFGIILVLSILSIPFYLRGELETASIKIKDLQLVVEIASDPKTREEGLMLRESLPEGRGMLFVYPDETKCRLWMKNTSIPLSAAFIKRDGRITQIIEMKKTNSTKIYKSKDKVKYALEVPLGYFKKMGIKRGDYCAIPYLASN